MTTVEEYELKAEAFRRFTGHMAPGKDAALGGYGSQTYAERLRLWDEWNATNEKMISAFVRAADFVFGSAY